VKSGTSTGSNLNSGGASISSSDEATTGARKLYLPRAGVTHMIGESLEAGSEIPEQAASEFAASEHQNAPGDTPEVPASPREQRQTD